jgi:hypothetical protein
MPVFILLSSIDQIIAPLMNLREHGKANTAKKDWNGVQQDGRYRKVWVGSGTRAL